MISEQSFDMVLIPLTFLCAILCLSSGNLIYQRQFDDLNATVIKVIVDTDKVINVVEEHFISFTLDSSTFSPHGLKLNLSSVKLRTLMKALSPSYFRIGGTKANWLFFNIPPDVLKSLQLKPGAYVMTEQDLINLVGLTRSTGNRLLFDLNIELRYGDQWDPSNAIELLQFCSKMGFGDNMDWELGNEPHYSSPGKLIPELVGRDFVLLRDLIRSYPNLNNSALLGPDVTGHGMDFLQSVANSSGDFLKAFTFHHYYFAGNKSTYKEYYNPIHLKNLPDSIQQVRTALVKTKFPNKKIWLGESSDAYNGGTANVSDRFVSGFLWMDKLGLAAQMGLDVVMRQSLCGENYGLLEVGTFEPNPDYWLSWIHRMLAGRKVFNLTISSSDFEQEPTTRIYAQCTKVGSTYGAGAVTAFALNMSPNKTKSLAFGGQLSQQEIDVYILSPGSADPPVLSKNVELNGILLKMPSDASMPALIPAKLVPGSQVTLPPLTFGFFVFPYANAAACR